MSAELPIHALRPQLEAALQAGPVVVSSPTGSGKSTEVPRWCGGRVLVVEPRRIACRSLAARVAELEGSTLGEAVGYMVRDEHVANAATKIIFATPGLVLRSRALLDGADCVILDEFHERSLDVDLLLGLLLRARRAKLVIMSATLDGDRIAAHVGGQHLTAAGRAFPVAIRYLPSGPVYPHATDLPARVQSALSAAEGDPGDVLVFLPGKSEIEACMAALRGRYELRPLHGGLGLREQQRAFDKTSQRKVVLATNVAETSLTIPGIGVVIDSGLARQTRYHDGRGYLVLGSIADDSAAQRAGRAGRTAPGMCYRLWSSNAQLAPTTPPELHRESLVPLVLTAAAWGAKVEDLPLLDMPKPHALEDARRELRAWGALQDDAAALSGQGAQLFALPLDPAQASLLLAAREHGCLDDMIDLVAVLSVGRQLFDRGTTDLPPDDDLRAAGCDATAAIRALRAQDPSRHGASSFVVREARQARARLRRLSGLQEDAATSGEVQREALIAAALAADPRLCHVSRGRGRERFFSNGGTELELARESAAHRSPKLEAVIALETRAFGAGRDARILITCAMPLPLTTVARTGLGEDRVGPVQLERGRITATLERVYAGRVIAEREDTPVGALARAALVTLLMRGSLFRDAITTTRERLARTALAAALERRNKPGAAAAPAPPPQSLEAWLTQRVETLGVESGDDLALLSASDFLAPDVPYELRSTLDEQYPLMVSVGDATYRAEYDVERGQVLLQMIKGSRRDAPPLAYLPKFPGLRICVSTPRGMSVVRAGGA
ncbi:MAG: helicase-related protein [Polyangiales bacterium]